MVPSFITYFFADDIYTILFVEASIEQSQVMQDVLSRFCKASGRKVSCAKSRVYFSRNIPPNNQNEICNTLGITTKDDLGLYLGMSTITQRVTRDTFSHICEKIDRRLAGWKTKYLSLAGCITLAKSTVSSIAYYSMQTSKIPKNICDDIARKTRRFIWGSDEDIRRVHLISWDTL